MMPWWRSTIATISAKKSLSSASLLGRARPRHCGEAADVEEHREQHGKDDRLCPHALLFAAQDLASRRLRVAVSRTLRHRGQASQRMALRRGHGKKPRCK
jgi:hypothetical protein